MYPQENKFITPGKHCFLKSSGRWRKKNFTGSCDHITDKLNEYYSLTKNNGRAESIPRCLCRFVRLFSIVLCFLIPTTILVLSWRAGLLGSTKVLQHRESTALAWPGPCKLRQVLSASAHISPSCSNWGWLSPGPVDFPAVIDKNSVPLTRCKYFNSVGLCLYKEGDTKAEVFWA